MKLILYHKGKTVEERKIETPLKFTSIIELIKSEFNIEIETYTLSNIKLLDDLITLELSDDDFALIRNNKINSIINEKDTEI